MEMDTSKDATNQPPTVDKGNKELQSKLIAVDSEGFSNVDEDLSPEEAECLEYLLQTINTVEGELSQEDEGAEDQYNSSVCDHMQESTSRKAAPSQPVSKAKMIKSFSEASIDLGLRRRPDPHCPEAKRSPAPISPLRKFDTILKSGVNVQELRSHFLLQLDSSAEVKDARKAAVRTIKQSQLFSGQQKSPRDEALRKLGLLQRNASFPHANGPPPAILSSQHAQRPLTEVLNSEATLSAVNTSGEPVDRQIGPTAQEKSASSLRS
ncbi:uncharacterized protein LOC125429974 [Sphaerodactylus townsendi]|uniref:Uncharacterized protein n=1 Tax=Sphaerodactylus townsendi TaxID=933632 RepID=A0ACB8EGI6_9SAUR|nr:uncharacterized protein LOC125429974 [Sphaerodactylus townsendi]